MSDNVHHELSPSAFPAWSVCPSYEPSREPTAEAEAGTAAHAALMAAIRGEKITQVSEEHAEVVAWALDEIRKTAGDEPLETEVKVTYYTPTGEELYYGRADVVGRSELWEFKTAGDAERPYIYQIAAYVLAAATERCLPGMTGTLLLGGSRKVVRQYMTVEEAAALVGFAIGARRQYAGEIFKPCDYCSLCARSVSCPALVAPSTAIASLRGEAAVDAWRQKLAALAHPSQIADPQTMALALDVARAVSDWADSVQHHAKVMALRGDVPPGYALQTRRGRETIAADVVAARIGAWVLQDIRLPMQQVIRSVAKHRDITEAKARLTIATLAGDAIDVGEETRALVRARKGGENELGSGQCHLQLER